MNRVIRARDLDAIYVTGPGPRRARRSSPTPGSRAPTPRSTPTSRATRTGMRRLFRQFSFPGGDPEPRRARDAGLDPRGRRARLRARRTPTARPSTTPTCSSAASSATARPRPGRSPRAGTRTSSSTPARDGAVLPILHLNGYKIANPTVLARIPRGRADARCSRATATRRIFVEGDEPDGRAPGAWPTTLDDGARRDRARSSARARADGARERPALADDRAAHAEGLDRARRRSTACRSRARGARTRCRSPTLARRTPSTCAQLEAWMR